MVLVFKILSNIIPGSVSFVVKWCTTWYSFSSLLQCLTKHCITLHIVCSTLQATRATLEIKYWTTLDLNCQAAVRQIASRFRIMPDCQITPARLLPDYYRVPDYLRVPSWWCWYLRILLIWQWERCPAGYVGANTEQEKQKHVSLLPIPSDVLKLAEGSCDVKCMC